VFTAIFPSGDQLYGVDRETVASVLLTTNALPGDRAHWEQMFDTFAPDNDLVDQSNSAEARQ
jgi:hypothetical protein